MMKLKLLSFLVFTLLGTVSLTAQKKNNDVEVIEFGEEGGEQSDYVQGNFIIKTSPVSFIFGNQMFEVERYISDILSIQAGVGLTFNSVYEGLWDSDIVDELSFNDNVSFCESTYWPEQDDICDDFVSSDNRRLKPGFLISTSARLFFNDDAMDGQYFAFKFRFSTKNYEIQDILPNQPFVERSTNQWFDEDYTAIDIVGQYGYQVLYSKLTAEYFVGLGIRFAQEKRQDLGYEAGIVRSHLTDVKTKSPRIEAGIRIGFQL